MIEIGLNDGGLELIDDTYYYRGESPKNWIQFDGVTGDNSLWRMISIENDVIKIIRNKSIDNIVWDESRNNNWVRPATLNIYLNETYKDQLPKVIQYRIQLAKFYIGTITWNTNNATVNNIRRQEKSTTWTGYIGLMNASDYVYTSTNSACVSNVILNKNCTKNNWLANSEQWLINADNRVSTETVMLINSNGLTSSMADTDVFCVHPVIYLGSDMKIASGQGTENDPFIVK